MKIVDKILVEIYKKLVFFLTDNKIFISKSLP